MALNSVICAGVSLWNYSLTQWAAA